MMETIVLKCAICGRGEAAKILGVCPSCIRKRPEEAEPLIREAHILAREPYPLPPEVPRSTDRGARRCDLCSNECVIAPGDLGYCGVRKNWGDRIVGLFPGYGILTTYEDSLPTNCCASWFCPGTLAPPEDRKVNVAVFLYGCNFDCLFCQNESHRRLHLPPLVSLEALVSRIGANPGAECVCYFGGSPEPQLPFALRASKRLLDLEELVGEKDGDGDDDIAGCWSGGLEDKVEWGGDGGRRPRICWEMNGCGNPTLVKRAAELSLRSGGIVKFDLKAFDENLSLALSGVYNWRAYENFEMIAKCLFEAREAPVLTATTLLVPGYVDEVEVGAIAEFIAGLNPDIPYTLLVFHPDFMMRDLPITPRSQAVRCIEAANKHLSRVYLGNKHMLAFAPP
ncbi:MAG: radical SAM protein [Methanothrix harundinacea]|jgi:pyruvate formate lyase activating enzyme|nr:radical SAM protein [Methanothrix harundinacea]